MSSPEEDSVRLGLPLLSDLLCIQDRISESVDAVELEASLFLRIGDEANESGLVCDGSLPAKDVGQFLLGLRREMVSNPSLEGSNRRDSRWD